MAKTGEAQVKLTLIDKLTAPLNRIKARLATLGKNLGFDRIGAQLNNVGSAFNKLGDGLTRSAMRFATAVTAIGAAAAGLGIAAYKIVQDTAELGAGLKESATKLGIGVEPLQEWRYAAEMSAISGEELDRAIAKLGVNASASVRGNKQMASSFKALGVRVKDANGKMKPTEAILQDTLYALADMRDPLRRNELAMKLFGKSGVELAKMMADGSKGIKELREEARRTGSIVSDETAAMGDAFGDNVDKLKKYLEGLKNTIGAALLPVVNDLVVRLTAWMDANRELIKSTITDWVKRLTTVISNLLDPTSDLRKSIADIVSGFSNFADKLTAVYDAAKPLVDYVGGPMKATFLAMAGWIAGPTLLAVTSLAAAFGRLGLAILTTPIGWIALGIGMLGAGVYVLIEKWDEFINYWENLWPRIKSAFDSSWTEGIETALKEFNPLVHIARGWNAVFEYFTGINLIDEGTRIMESFSEGVRKKFGELSTWASAKWTEITAVPADAIDRLMAAGAAIVQALWDGLKAKWTEVETWVANSIKNLIPEWAPSWLKDSLGLKVDGKPGEDGKSPVQPKDGTKAAKASDDVGGFLKDFIKNLGKRAFGASDAIPEIASNVIKFERPKVETPRFAMPALDTPSVSSVIQFDQAVRARTLGIGGNTTETAPGKTKDDLGIGTPQSINASNLTVGSVTMPEPIVAHEPQVVNAPFNVGGITINAQGDANSIAGAVKSALAAQAEQQRRDIQSRLSD